MPSSNDRAGNCATCLGEGAVERVATPEEVDAGYELGIAYDPCPACSPDRPIPDIGVLVGEHYEYPRSVLIEEARKYAARSSKIVSTAQEDYFITTLADAVERMWGVMQRACNYPESWNAILSKELDSWRPQA